MTRPYSLNQQPDQQSPVIKFHQVRTQSKIFSHPAHPFLLADVYLEYVAVRPLFLRASAPQKDSEYLG